MWQYKSPVELERRDLMPLPFTRIRRPVCVSFGMCSLTLPSKVGTSTSPPKCGNGKTDRQFAMQVQAVALKDFVLSYADIDVQIACRRAVLTRLALAAQADALTVVDACRNVDFNRFAGFGAPSLRHLRKDL